MKKICATSLLAVLFSTTVYAGLPLVDTTKPIKVSASENYKCDNKGQAFSKQDNGTFTLLEGVTCHDDHLWLKGKAMTFIDMINYVADDYYNSKVQKEHLLNSKH